jgi:hypothetical protein
MLDKTSSTQNIPTSLKISMPGPVVLIGVLKKERYALL